MQSQSSTRTVERALDILTAFQPAEGGLTLTEVANRVHVHKSTVYRLLHTLAQRQFVQYTPRDGRYHLGLKVVELGLAVLKSNDIHRQSLPYLQALCEECRETVDLAILDGQHMVYLAVVESHQRMKFAATPGQRLPVFCTASGRAFLAYMPHPQAEAILKTGLHKFTDTTRATRASILRELQVVREQGFAISFQEYEQGVNAVAAPILDADQHPLAAIAIVGPAFRLPAERLLELGRRVRQVANSIAVEMGLSLGNEVHRIKEPSP